MVTKGRVAGIVVVAVTFGFVAGAWFTASGLAFRFLAPPQMDPELIQAARLKKAAIPQRPKVPAVDVPNPVVFNGGSAGLPPVADRSDLMPAPGCGWEVEPRPFGLSSHWVTTDPARALAGLWAVDPTTKGLRYTLIQSTRKGGSSLDLRPVFFDAEANRFVPRAAGKSSSRSSEGAFLVDEFMLDPNRQLSREKVAYFAIERVVPNAAVLLMEATQREAKKKGVAILPAPILGKPFPFDFLAADGKPVRSEDFRGKAVLVVVASADGSSQMGLMNVKNVRKANKAEDLAIVGVSFEGSPEDARDTFAKMGVDGPLVVVPNDKAVRRLWREGAQIYWLPTFFLVDSKGDLRFICNSINLADHVDILFGRAKRSPFGAPFKIARPARGGSPAPPTGPMPAPPTIPPGISGE